MELARQKQARIFAAQIRIETLKALGHLGFGHLGGSLSIADLLAVLYSGEMKVDPANPNWEDRDFLVCSKGHAGPAIYATLALRGFFPKEELLTLNAPETRLPSHTDMNRTPGVDMTTGSLGQGFSSGLGIALGCKRKGLGNYVYILLGDGECEEGQVWECAAFAPAHGLDNVIAFVDYSGLQLDGPVDEVGGVKDLSARFAAFGWHALDVADGNDPEQILRAIDAAKAEAGRPSMLILHTKKGKGCFFAEDVFNHNMPVTAELADEAVARLEAAKAAL